MKKLFILLLLLLSSASFAQLQSFDSTYIDGLKKDIWGTHKEIIQQNLKLTEDEAKIFWPVYQEYIDTRSRIFDKKVAVTEEFLMNYYALDDATAKDLLGKAFSADQELLNTQKEYMDKMLKVLPAPLVGRFFQVDTRITALANIVRMSSTPLIREKDE